MKKFLLLILCFGLSLNVKAQSTLLLPNDTGNASSELRKPIEDFGTIYFFQNIDSPYGKRYTLAKSGGTEATTSIIKDPSLPNPGPYVYAANANELIRVNNLMFFSANNHIDRGEGQYTAEPWVSDGTAAGTHILKQVEPNIFYGSNPHSYTAFGSKVLFLASNNVPFGEELYITDGTEAGTYMLKDINPGQPGSGISNITILDGQAYFWANDGTHGIELWRTDGTSFGTQMVQDFNIGAQSINDQAINPIHTDGYRLYFNAYSPGEGLELAFSNGNSINLVPVSNGMDSTSPSQITPLLNGKVAFIGKAGNINKLYQANQNVFSGMTVGEVASSVGLSFSNPADLIKVNYDLFFTAFDATDGIALWRIPDYYTNLADKVSDINTQPYVSGIDDTFPLKTPENNQRQFIEHYGSLYFVAKNAVNGFELWKYNVSSNFLSQLPDINISGSSKFSHFTKTVSLLYFLAYDGTNYDMWRTDLSTNNLYRFSNYVNTNPFQKPYPFIGNQNSNDIFFTAYDNATGYELYKTNGETFTQRVKDINTGQNLNTFETFSNKASNINRTIFIYQDRINGAELWTTNGKTVQTKLLMDSNPYPIDIEISKTGSYDYSKIYSEIIEFQNNFYFELDNKIWKTDGINTPTILLDNNQSFPLNFVQQDYASDFQHIEFNNYLYLVYNNKLWKTDGLSNQLIFTPQDYIIKLRKMGGSLYFVSADSVLQGDCIYKTNGLPGGETIVKNFGYFSQLTDSQFREFVATGTHIYFLNYNATNSGYQVWKTDGTNAGTSSVLDLGNNILFDKFYAFNNLVYFHSFDNSYNNNKIFRSDGTVAGTFSVLNDKPLSDFHLFKNAVYLNVLDASYNRFIYKTNGTVAGTTLNQPLDISGSSNFASKKAYYLLSYNVASATNSLLRWDGILNGAAPAFNFPINNNLTYWYNRQEGNGLLYFAGEFQTSPTTYQTGIHVIKDCHVNYDGQGVVNSNNVVDALLKITSTENISTSTNNNYSAIKSIELRPGFKVNTGAVFSAKIENACQFDPNN